jgi:hypothetical protein
MSLSQEAFESREGIFEMVPKGQRSVANGNPALGGKVEGARRIRYTPGIKSALVLLLTATHVVAARETRACTARGALDLESQCGGLFGMLWSGKDGVREEKEWI